VTDSYIGEVEDISVDESSRNTSVAEAGIRDSYSDSSAAIQAPQWVEVKTSGLPQHKTSKHSLRYLRMIIIKLFICIRLSCVIECFEKENDSPTLLYSCSKITKLN
jgi:hypothetical protein